MGQFSWLDCVSDAQIVDDKIKDVYLLVPNCFGDNIKETCYDGYGNFGGHDVFDLIADWNREILSKKSDFILPYTDLKLCDKKWYDFYADLNLTREEVVEKVKEKIGNDFFEWRIIGIDLACYDEDNEALPYPIKITYKENAKYEWCSPSKSDPNQGWECDNDDEWDEEWDDEY